MIMSYNKTQCKYIKECIKDIGNKNTSASKNKKIEEREILVPDELRKERIVEIVMQRTSK